MQAPPGRTDDGIAASPSLRSLAGRIAARMLLGAVYFAVVTPISLVLRSSRRAPLDVKFRDGKPSYWITKTPAEATLRRYEKTY